MAPGVGPCCSASGSGVRLLCAAGIRLRCSGRVFVCAFQRLENAGGGIPLPAFSGSDPGLVSVVDISVLDHAVGVVVRDDDMIENENPDSIQKALELKC